MSQPLKEVVMQYIVLGATKGVASRTDVVVNKGNLDYLMHQADFSMSAHVRELKVVNHGRRILVDGELVTLDLVGSPILMTLAEALDKRGEILGKYLRKILPNEI